MEPNFQQTAETASAFQKIWAESFSKTMQAAFATGPNAPPPEILRQIRSGIFQALAQSWDEFMRSPQFLDGMKQWMESAVVFRKMTNEVLARAHGELQSPSRQDIDNVMLAMRHMEQRLLDRVEQLSAQVNELKAGARVGGQSRSAAKFQTKARGRTIKAARPRTRGK